MCGNSSMHCVFFRGHPQKEGVSPTMNKNRIKPVNDASFVNHLCSAPSVQKVHSDVTDLPVGGRLTSPCTHYNMCGRSLPTHQT